MSKSLPPDIHVWNLFTNGIGGGCGRQPLNHGLPAKLADITYLLLGNLAYNIWLWIAIVIQTTDGVEHCLGVNCNSFKHNVVVLNGSVLLHMIVIHKGRIIRI